MTAGEMAADVEFVITRFGDKVRSAAWVIVRDCLPPKPPLAALEQEGLIWLFEHEAAVRGWLDSASDDECSKRVYRRVRDAMLAWMRDVSEHLPADPNAGRTDSMAELWAAGASGTQDDFALDTVCDCTCHTGDGCCWSAGPEPGEAHDDCPDGVCHGEPCHGCDGLLFLADSTRAAWAGMLGHNWTAGRQDRPEQVAAFRQLRPEQQQMFWRVHRGDSQAEVARSMGMKQSGISKGLDSARAGALAAAGLTEQDARPMNPKPAGPADTGLPCCLDHQRASGIAGEPCPQHREMAAR